MVADQVDVFTYIAADPLSLGSRIHRVQNKDRISTVRV